MAGPDDRGTKEGGGMTQNEIQDYLGSMLWTIKDWDLSPEQGEDLLRRIGEHIAELRSQCES